MNETASVLAGCDVFKTDVVRRGAKQGDPRADEDGYTSDDEALNQAGAKKALDRNAPVNVSVLDAASGESRDDFRRMPRHMLYDGFRGSGGKRSRAEYKNRLLSVRLGIERQNRLVRFATNDQCIYRAHELIVAVGFSTARRQKIERTIDASDEAIEASANKNGRFHR